jgi:transposase-like protein
MATRRIFTQEFKLEAVKLVCERSVSIAQARRSSALIFVMIAIATSSMF